MRPLAVLIGIVMGSTVSIAVALAMTMAVFLLLPDQAARIDEELGPLARTLAFMTVVAGIAGLSFYGELRDRRWRRLANGGLILALGATAWMYWPRP